MIVKTFVLGMLENNVYLVIDEDSKEAVLIDCTLFSEDIINTLKEYGAKLKYILLTHGHFDHILGINEFRKALLPKVYVSQEDKTLVNNVDIFMGKYGMPFTSSIPELDGVLEEQDLKLGNKNIEVIHTPGHTKGSVCFLIDKTLFSGDTIFLESVGRTDLEGGSFTELSNSIKNNIYTLDDNTEIYPGHGPKTSVKHEKEYNQYV